MKKKIDPRNLKGLQGGPRGLSDLEVASQLTRFGANSILGPERSTWLDLWRETLQDPMVWFLLVIGSVFWLVGDHQEAIVLFVAMIPLLFMDAFLHWRTQASTQSLRGQLASQAQVMRSGQLQTVGTQQIVPGDLVLVDSDHPFLPADGYWESPENLQVDESVLTGEAFPVHKVRLAFNPFAAEVETLVETSQLGFAGSHVLTGTGYLRVLSTGRETAYGEIVQSVVALTHERTQLQEAIAKLTKGLVFVAGFMCLALASIRYSQGHGLLDTLLSAATLAVAAIPEEFPVVFTFYLGVGVYRLAKQKAWVRRAVSVENIGRVTSICTDKTGTLTRGEMQLTHLDPANGVSEEAVLQCAMVASSPEGTDPIDQAILALGEQRGLPRRQRQQVIPFAEDRKRETAFYQDQGHHYCVMKGAPETLIGLTSLSVEERELWFKRTDDWAKQGHKVLGVSYQELGQQELLSLGTEPAGGFQFAGLLAFEDPPRPEVRGAVESCLKGGIRVLMLTGDHPQTAAAIAREIGLATETSGVLSAETNADQLEPAWLKANPESLKGIHVIARCNPLQKLRVVEALKASGEVVAVTGDGVNDVPALKAADVGIAMGLRGARSAKEVSSIILADDNFSTIVNAVAEGRQLLANLRRSFEYLLLIHLPFVLSAAILPLLGYPLLYLPIHVIWLELIIHPTALFAFQEVASDHRMKVTSDRTPFFSRQDLLRIALLSLLLTAALCWFFLDVHGDGSPVDLGRSKVLTLLSLWSAGLAVVLTRGRGRAAQVIAALTVALSACLTQIDVIARTLHLSPMSPIDWLEITLLVSLALVGLVFFRRFDF